ncbi:MAG: response regulator [Saprospiraceae bacterium]|jgi:YesN/AraC family two-component response regulator
MGKILVVDDEEDQEELIMQRFATKDYLQGYQFLFANDGLKGLAMVKIHPDIDLALLDINMPGMDGLTLLEEIKSINPLIQVIMLSAYGDMSNIRKAMNHGAFDFLNKPIDVHDLNATIKKTISEVERLKENAKIIHENLILNQRTTELEMHALRAQMNPHFIFNALSSINNFILKNEKSFASEYLIKFSKLIRLILENSKQPLISLGLELDALKLYTDIEKLRFEQQFDYELFVDPEVDTTSIKVPPLILQPFVENAIHHGLMPKQDKGSLQIFIRESGSQLKISIVDNGVGRSYSNTAKKSSDHKKRSMGISLSTDRLSLLSLKDEAGKIEILDLVQSNGVNGGTEVIITIPIYL